MHSAHIAVFTINILCCLSVGFKIRIIMKDSGLDYGKDYSQYCLKS